MLSEQVPFAGLPDADLVVDRVYKGGTAGTVADDPLARLLPVGNQGGFRYKGSPSADTVKLIVLYTTGAEASWPDHLDIYTGDFAYWGDNRSPGTELHTTQRRGNLLLSKMYALSNEGPNERAKVAPFLLFDKPGTNRDVRFRGLLAPGSPRLPPEEELVAVWRSTKGHRFQNYRAHFTVLDTLKVSRDWLSDVIGGNTLGTHCPDTWRRWVVSRAYRPLIAPPTITVRSRAAQTPVGSDLSLLEHIHGYFADQPTRFEHFAAELWRMAEPNVQRIDVTRPWRDGGRDAVGEFVIGPDADPVTVEFALEAKCYAPGRAGVGVKEVSRLISRLRHRQFGVLVTTAHVSEQAYREIRTDGHPVVILAGCDIANILKSRGLDNDSSLELFLNEQYPKNHVAELRPTTQLMRDRILRSEPSDAVGRRCIDDRGMTGGPRSSS
jgi:hypothetical protein